MSRFRITCLSVYEITSSEDGVNETAAHVMLNEMPRVQQILYEELTDGYTDLEGFEVTPNEIEKRFLHKFVRFVGKDRVGSDEAGFISRLDIASLGMCQLDMLVMVKLGWVAPVNDKNDCFTGRYRITDRGRIRAHACAAIEERRYSGAVSSDKV